MEVSTNPSILERFRHRVLQEFVAFGVTLPSILAGSALTTGCDKPNQPEQDKHFSITSDLPLTASKDAVIYFSPDTLHVVSACKNITATVKVNYQGDQEGHRDESFVVWIARLIKDPNDSTRYVPDIDNAIPFRPTSSVPCDAVVDDSTGVTGVVTRKIGILTDYSNNPAPLLEGDHLVFITHAFAHNAECGRTGEPNGQNSITVMEITLNGETILYSKDPQIYFVGPPATSGSSAKPAIPSNGDDRSLRLPVLEHAPSK